MFIDALKYGRPAIDCDVAIFGAGVAGITIAQALARTSLSVCLVESGGAEMDDNWQKEFSSRSVGVPCRPAEGRVRTFGGSTALWSGRCARLDPSDFAPRAHVADSGWPIDHSVLEPFYSAATRIMGFGETFDDHSQALARLARLVPADAPIAPFVWRYAAVSRDRYQHWGDAFHDALAASERVWVLLNSDIVALDSGEFGGHATQARIRTRSGRNVAVRARHFVIACGGIESARLLLNFADDNPVLMSGAGDAVGRYFMQHPRAVTASMTTSPRHAARLQRLLNCFRRSAGPHDETGFALTVKTQEEHRLLNGSIVLRYRRPWVEDELSEVAPAARRASLDDWFGEARPDRIGGRLVRKLRGWEQLVAHPQILVVADVEQEPDRESRIRLDGERDILGLRTAEIDWRINPPEEHTAAFLTHAVCDWLASNGLGQATPLDGMAEHGGLVPGRMLESYHHLGATRMSDSSATGVVDADLRVHGTDNLYVCGGSVMPTGGHANPTLTIAALALRLAERLSC